MSEINVKVRSRAQTLYNTKIVMKLEEPVGVLKKKICEKHEGLQESLLEAVYCGCAMEDNHPICTYGVFRGATVHVFVKTQTKKPSTAVSLDKNDMIILELALCIITMSPAYRKSIKNHTRPQDIDNIIRNIPSLIEDPAAVALLPHLTSLVKLSDFDVKHLAQNHPALASAILHLIVVANDEVKDKDMRPVTLNGSDEDMEHANDSSTASETSIPSVSRNSYVETLNVAQPTSEITSVTNQQPQPSTSEARTLTINTGNPFHHSVDFSELATRIELLRDIGLTDEAQHLSILLQISNMLDAAFV